MSRTSEPHHREALLHMARPCPFPEWMLLELPNAMFAAFWSQGFETDNCIAVAEGRYRDACSYRSRNKDRVLLHMKRNQNI